MGAAFPGIDRVDVTVDLLVVRGGILEGDLEFELVLGIFLGDIDGYRVEAFGTFVQVFHELDKPAGIAVGCRVAGPLIGDDDGEPGVQERKFPHAVGEHIVIEGGGLEDGGVRDKMDPGAGHLFAELLKE